MGSVIWLLGSVITYLSIGFGIASWDAVRLHQRIKDCPNYSRNSWQHRAEVARGIFFATALLWPARAPYLLAVRIADKHNPDLIARDLRRREEEIADRELEIRRLERKMQLGEAVIPLSQLSKPTLEQLRPGGWKDPGDSCT